MRPLQQVRAIRYSFFLTVLLAGCGFSESRVAAEAIADAVYRERAGRVSEALLDMYSPRFYEYVSRDDWARMLQNIRATLGDYRSHELVDWTVHKGTSELGTGTRVTLVYRVVYSNHESTEQLHFFGREPQIVGHQINSPGLLLGE
jgi:hypothetical protein